MHFDLVGFAQALMEVTTTNSLESNKIPSALVVIALDLLTMLPSAGGVVAGGWQSVGVAGLLGAGVILFQQTL